MGFINNVFIFTPLGGDTTGSAVFSRPPSTTQVLLNNIESIQLVYCDLTEMNKYG